MKKTSLTRRRFLHRTGQAAAGALAFPFVASRNVLGANNRLNVAGIGVGGKGQVDIDFCAGENVVALCDIDEERAAASRQRFPQAKFYRDFRELFDKESNTFDAVTVSTPDHTHAWPTLRALDLGKHVYCQKPLTHTVHEARLVAQLAREKGVVTQMGNQGHCHPDSRRLVELIRANVLGQVKEIHVWTDRPIWPQGLERPGETPPVPKNVAWDLFLGPAPQRPYHPAYHPFNWRGWWDFGTGALGDMGCHNMDLAYFALQLQDPVSVEAKASDHFAETAPKWSIITYNFPRPGAPILPLTWYDGGRKPDPSLAKEKELPNNGCILVGTEDTLYVPHYWGAGRFLSGARTEDFTRVPQSLPRWPGSAENNDRAHHHEWIEACKGNAHALSSFNTAGPMTEAVLLGNVALRAGAKVEWNATQLKVTNHPEANQFIKKEYRRGWELPV